MSRLDQAIRRLEAQRLLLDRACLGLPEGPVLELGLGNGRTYDHLRQKLGRARAIHVFERHVAVHPDCLPPETLLHLGDMRDTLPEWAAAHGAAAVLAHADTGSGDSGASVEFAAFLAGALPLCLAIDAIVLSDQALNDPRLAAGELPGGIEPGRYFIYRRV